MFTGIVREVGRIEAVEEGGDAVRLVVRAPETAAAAAVGDSIALAGVCLTAVEVVDGTVAFDAVPETLRALHPGPARGRRGVNVEPALRAGEPLGGHIVQGHVDGVGPHPVERATRGSRSTLRPRCSAIASRRARSRSRASA